MFLFWEFFCLLKVRSNLFEEFQEGRARVLVCTDIASRGVDPDVSMNEVYFILLSREGELSGQKWVHAQGD